MRRYSTAKCYLCKKGSATLRPDMKEYLCDGCYKYKKSEEGGEASG